MSDIGTNQKDARDDDNFEWGLAFWRELFQSAAGARAKTIGVDIDKADVIGFFGLIPIADNSVRVGFTYDGAEMDKNSARDLILRLGKTPKTVDEENTSKLRAARIMAGTLVLYGYGSGYTCMSKKKKIEALERPLGHDEDGHPPTAVEAEHKKELLELRASPPFVLGCMAKIDIDPSEFKQTNSSKADHINTLISDLKGALMVHLAMSKIPSSVFVGGVEVTEQVDFVDYMANNHAAILAQEMRALGVGDKAAEFIGAIRNGSGERALSILPKSALRSLVMALSPMANGMEHISTVSHPPQDEDYSPPTP